MICQISWHFQFVFYTATQNSNNMPGSDFEKMDDGTFRKKMDNTMNLDTCKKQAAPVAMWTWGHIHTKF